MEVSPPAPGSAAGPPPRPTGRRIEARRRPSDLDLPAAGAPAASNAAGSQSNDATAPTLLGMPPPGQAPAPSPAARAESARDPSAVFASMDTVARPAASEPADLGWSDAGLDEVPAAVGSYRIVGEIARGGMGIVLRAQHAQLGREVALKLLRADAADEGAHERFLLEARAAARLRHASIVQVHDVARDDRGRAFLVMDLVRGKSLKAILDTDGPLEPRRAAEVVEAIALAVHHAHGEGILHRDLKPHNVLIDRATGAPLLTDFGLAKVLRGRKGSSGSTTGLRAADIRAAAASSEAAGRPADLTGAGEILGTPLYMAPEQVDPERAPLGPHTDVYGLGAILYEALTGRPPVDGASALEIFDHVLTKPPVPPSALAPRVPAELEGIAMRCLAKNPRARYRGADEVARELGRFRAGQPVLGQVWKRPAASSASGGVPVSAFVLLGLLVVIAGIAYARPDLRARVATLVGASPAPPVDVPPPVGQPNDGPPVDGPPADRPPVDRPPGLLGAPPTLLLSPEPIEVGNARRLAQAGYADAMRVLGLATLEGRLRPPPGLTAAEEGIEWLERAAEAGLPQALTEAADLRLYGALGVPIDPALGQRWLERGVQAGVPRCMLELARLNLARRGPAAAPEALQLLERAEAIAALPPEGQLLRADLLGHGPPGVNDPPRAVVLWTALAEGGDATAMLRLSSACDAGRGTVADPRAARSWLERAAATGLAEAQYQLGVAHEVGKFGLPPSVDDARTWYIRAAQGGSPEARQRLSVIGAPGH